MSTSILRPALVAAAALAVTGCASYGGHGHDYTGISYGYASPSYYGYASPYYGWYDGYYYPGTGYYVYERSGVRHRWTDRQRNYWRSHRGDHRRGENWSGYRGHQRDRDHDHGDHRRWRTR